MKKLTEKQKEIYLKMLVHSENGKYILDRFFIDKYKPISMSIIKALENSGLIRDIKPKINAFERRNYKVIIPPEQGESIF